ncbi:MAG: acetyl-CoA/propionyl-CoA carboxylase carboxyl transferase subunit, partial [Actinomycetota bacterium]|nr:acetyl-CoA/propionyl-CoA carboxylase carboxyl transferase subunit [Actinomycetota bacterium]
LRPSLELELAAEHEKLAGSIDKAVAIGVVDEVVSPASTRSTIAEAIASAPQAHGSHGNIPL